MPPEKRKLRNILKDLKKVEEYITKRKKVNLFLDFDGTLAPITSSPDKVRMPHEVRSILAKMNEYNHVCIAIISGRAIENIKDIVDINGIYYAGNHGLEISGVKRSEIVPNAAQIVKSIKKISDDLNNVLLTVPGSWVENKTLTASVHYRNVGATYVPELNRLVGEITARYVEKGLVKLTRGKKIIDIHPNVNWDKGKAVKWMQKNIAEKRAGNIYIGDDDTDEVAFKVLNSSITVKVSKESRIKTNAQYFVNNPTEVRYFLQWLLEKVSTP